MSNKPTILQAWDQRKDETDKSYDRFSVYLQLGSERSMEKARKKLGKSKGYIGQLERWSSKYSWVDRAKEYDEHLIKKQLDNKEEVIEIARGKLLGLLDKSVNAVSEVLDLPNYSLSKDVSSNATSKLKAAEMVFDRLGLVKHKDPGEGDPIQDRNTYIQNIFQKIDNYVEQNDPERES